MQNSYKIPIRNIDNTCQKIFSHSIYSLLYLSKVVILAICYLSTNRKKLKQTFV